MSFPGGAAASAVIGILGDNRPLVRALGQTDTLLGRWARGLQTKFGTLFKIGFWAAIAAGVVAVSAAIVKLMSSSIKAAEDAEVAYAKFNKTLNNVGNTTGKTGEEFDKMFENLQKLTGLSRITGVNMATQLLKGRLAAEEFNRAFAISADLTVAWGVSGEDAANRIAIALTDVDVGIRKLRNKFIFTAEENKRFREANTTLEKQRLLLDVLENHYKGLAEEIAKTTFAGAKAQLMNEIMDRLRQIGTALIPIMNQLTRAITGMVPIIEFAIQVWKELIAPLWSTIAALMEVNRVTTSINPAWAEFFGWVTKLILPLNMFVEILRILDIALYAFGRQLLEISQGIYRLATGDFAGVGENLKNLIGLPEELVDRWEKVSKLQKEMQDRILHGPKTKTFLPSPPLFGEDEATGKKLTGRFESLEQTWKRISSAALKGDDQTKLNTAATKANTKALQAWLSVYSNVSSSSLGRTFTPRRQVSGALPEDESGGFWSMLGSEILKSGAKTAAGIVF